MQWLVDLERAENALLRIDRELLFLYGKRKQLKSIISQIYSHLPVLVEANQVAERRFQDGT
jgi:hypothetical protein